VFRRVAVVGLGYVGFPAAVSFALAGLKVYGVDVDPAKVEAVNSGSCPSEEPDVCRAYRVAFSRGLLEATTDYSKTALADAIVFAVPTPVKRRRPDTSILESAVAEAARHARPGTLFSIESTIPPGTTRALARVIEAASGGRLVAGSSLYLAHVPERIAPGKSLEEMRRIPRLVGGLDGESTRRALELYSLINESPVAVTAEEAELAKIAENTYRDLNIAFANFLAMTAERLGVDAWKVIRAANTHPRVNIHLPGAGVGGPCLTKDPYMLAAAGNSLPGAEIVTVARAVNDHMPAHTVEILAHALAREGIRLGEATVAVLGAAYKGGIGDTRESPSAKIVERLLGQGAAVRVHDPYTGESFGASRAPSVEDAVRGANAVVIATDHPEYKSLNWAELARLMATPIIVDGRRVLEPEQAEEAGLKYYGVGYPW